MEEYKNFRPDDPTRKTKALLQYVSPNPPAWLTRASTQPQGPGSELGTHPRLSTRSFNKHFPMASCVSGPVLRTGQMPIPALCAQKGDREG